MDSGEHLRKLWESQRYGESLQAVDVAFEILNEIGDVKGLISPFYQTTQRKRRFVNLKYRGESFENDPESINQPLRFELRRHGRFKLSAPAELMDVWKPRFESFDLSKRTDRFVVRNIDGLLLDRKRSRELFRSLFKACLDARRERMMAMQPRTGEELDSGGFGTGGGLFGTTAQNEAVERAAIDFATRYYGDKGWKVETVERENRGFDLRCVRRSEEEHVEVKGVKGSGLSFIITAGEVRYLEESGKGVVFIVNNALTKPAPTRRAGREFLDTFELQPLSFRASIKKEKR